MYIKDLPKSLIQATEEVISSSSKHTKKLSKIIFSEGLKKFNVSDVNQLSDSDQKAFFSWTQNEFNKRYPNIKVIEESMTDQDKFSALRVIPHVQSRYMDGGKAISLSLMGKELATKFNTKKIMHIMITPEGENLLKSKGITNLDKTLRMRIFPESESDCGCNKMQEDDMPGDAILHVGGDANAAKKKEIDENNDAEDVVKSELKKIGKELGELSSDEKKALFNKVDSLVKAKNEEYTKGTSMNESVAIASDELATNGAVGCTDADSQMPVHADVLKDSSPIDGKAELRLFLQFNTNSLPIIIPPAVLPGAPDINSLREIVEDLPVFCDVVEKALVAFAEMENQPKRD